MEHDDLNKFCSLEYFVSEFHRFPRSRHNKLIVLPEKCTRRSLAPLMVSKSRSGEACRQEEVRFVSAIQHGRNIRGKRRCEKKWHEGDGRTVETTVINLDVITYRWKTRLIFSRCYFNFIYMMYYYNRHSGISRSCVYIKNYTYNIYIYL